ncbi:hypothetical protein BJY18_001388 [Amycolatopsis jiangsuensis]|uniref:Uncharacterized protein n=1 Tax=Amycolatopsis jiangsuensis TaxID=1181879 RepID=A0A840IPW7_9PSEU|nr:hypothetical protein [Amycolatopsis jiangsuensis]MBB4683903.1 hypothetical protein [Amycolatopsis jiangsuensis]
MLDTTSDVIRDRIASATINALPPAPYRVFSISRPTEAMVVEVASAISEQFHAFFRNISLRCAMSRAR